jgi:hypothetical protein
VEVLLNIFYTTLIDRSLASLISMVMNPTHPLLKLTLVVDRQTLKIH